MTIIKSPYNFVPFNAQVITPYWVRHISHDIPFEDAQSGIITVKVKAQSPIFVRNGALKNTNEDAKVIDFSAHGGKYFLPGSSLKGMIRNTIEILSFSKMGNKVNDHRYAIRDLSGAVKKQYLDFFTPDKIYCGWLYKEKGSYQIVDCGLPGRIEHKHLDNIYKTKFNEFYIGKDYKGSNEDHKSAKYKYETMFSGKDRDILVRKVETRDGRDIFEIDPTGKKGKLVFTGQPGIRKQITEGKDKGKWTGHYLEFVFFEPKSVEDLLIKDSVMDDFLFAYFEHDKTRWSVDWKYWRGKLNDGKKIPIFFHKPSPDSRDVSALGLSYLFKLPYRNSVTEAMNQDHNKADIDLSEALFGHISAKNELDALKGRVHFGHAFATNDLHIDKVQNEVLSSPKASYYPNYIRQSINKEGKVTGYKTFMDDGATIAGWKRYPIHSGNNPIHNPAPSGTNEKLTTTFIPIKSGAEFQFEIRYHNLRPIELGALLSGLTFHNTPGTFHSLGMAKPLGYGKVTLDVSGVEQQAYYLGLFESFMDQQLKKPWYTHSQITELVTMASEQQNQGNSTLEYMKLTKGGLNDFSNAKDKKTMEALAQYSHLDGIVKKTVQSLVTDTTKQYVQVDAQKYTAFQNIERRKADHIEQERMKFFNALEQIKSDMRASLEKAKDAIAMNQVQAERMAKAKEAQKNSPNWEIIKVDSRDAFDDLKKLVEVYCKKYHGDNNYDRLKLKYPLGVLPLEHQEECLIIIGKIRGHAKGKDEQQWLNPYDNNPRLKKISEWIGQDKTKQALQP